jgi:NADH:ubiquinone oxidoreductase subunit 2 (subunit N)
MLISITLRRKLWGVFYLIYTIITTAVLRLIRFTKSKKINDLILITPHLSNKLMGALLILALGGIPPFIGFFSKLLVVVNITNSSIYLLLSPLMVILSAGTLFYYLRIVLQLSLSSAKTKKYIEARPLTRVLM